VTEFKGAILKELQSPSSPWHYKMTRLLHLCVETFQASGQSENINPCLRVFEIFSTENRDGCSKDDCIRYFTYLLPRGYFESIRRLCDSRVPPIIDETSRPPTPMAELIFELITRPLKLMQGAEKSFKVLLAQSLNAAFFAQEFTEQVKLFILPALANSGFPTLDWMSGLSLADLHPTSCLLYSVLRVTRMPGKRNISRYKSLLSSYNHF
jgi:hypothetical protein